MGDRDTIVDAFGNVVGYVIRGGIPVLLPLLGGTCLLYVVSPTFRLIVGLLLLGLLGYLWLRVYKIGGPVRLVLIAATVVSLVWVAALGLLLLVATAIRYWPINQ